MILFRNGEMIEDSASVERRIVIDRAGRYDYAAVVLGSADARLDVSINAPGVEFTLNAVYVCSGVDRVDIRVNMLHACGGSSSSQLIKGVAAGRSRINFNGLIKVAHDAQKTSAFQTSANLLLSEDARVDTAPQLEIYADDVKCSHGASIGRLDEDEQFYMRSRGITLSEARRLQIISFIAPVTDGLPEELIDKINDSVSSLCV